MNHDKELLDELVNKINKFYSSYVCLDKRKFGKPPMSTYEYITLVRKHIKGYLITIEEQFYEDSDFLSEHHFSMLKGLIEDTIYNHLIVNYYFVSKTPEDYYNDISINFIEGTTSYDLLEKLFFEELNNQALYSNPLDFTEKMGKLFLQHLKINITESYKTLFAVYNVLMSTTFSSYLPNTKKAMYNLLLNKL